MAYEHIEELRTRKREKIALFLTAENLGGILALALPTYIATAALQPAWLRLVLLVTSALLGLAITADIGGMAVYERVLWWVRGRVRRLAQGNRIRAGDLPGAHSEQRVQPLAAKGPIRPVHFQLAFPPINQHNQIENPANDRDLTAVVH